MTAARAGDELVFLDKDKKVVSPKFTLGDIHELAKQQLIGILLQLLENIPCTMKELRVKDSFWLLTSQRRRVSNSIPIPRTDYRYQNSMLQIGHSQSSIDAMCMDSTQL